VTGSQPEVVAKYRHPQGKRITVYSDGTMECTDARGKRKPTSATPANLEAGHGAWQRVCLHCADDPPAGHVCPRCGRNGGPVAITGAATLPVPDDE
jgi:hypothetical protein